VTTTRRNEPDTARDHATVTEKVTLDVDGRARDIVVVRPESPADSPPVVLVFHGSHQNAAKVRTFSGHMFDDFAARAGAVVVYLDGYKKSWNDGRIGSSLPARAAGIDDVAFTRAAIDWVAGRYRNDPERVFAVGFSNGGQMVIRLVHEIGSQLAGAAIIAAAQPAPENFPAGQAEVIPLPTLLIHGTKDPLVPYAGGVASMWGFRPQGRGLSAQESAAYYARRNGITVPPETVPLSSDQAGDSTSVERTDYRQPGHPPVTLYTVHGGGHIIPGPRKAPRIMGRSTVRLVTSEAIADFFGLW
jgi:polyhydroxybutyrate depolymerase